MVLRFFLSFCLISTLIPCITASRRSLSGWADPSGWSPNEDGGHPPLAQADPLHPWQGQPSLGLTYADRPPHWGNLRHAVQIPPNATAISFRLFKISSQPQAQMFLWLFEEDGDGWIQEIQSGGRALGEMSPGWHEIQLLVAGFRFDPRGNRKREFLTVNRLLAGCNYGDLNVSLADWKFILKEEPPMSTLPHTDNLSIQRASKGSIAILKDQFPATGGASSPNALADILQKEGFGVTYLRIGDLCDAGVLQKENFDVLLLPYGPAYPADGRDALLAYLKSGGTFLSIGGYTFDRLLRFENGKWIEAPSNVTASEMDAQKAEIRINTRFGRPGDALGLQPDQIGVFDPSYELGQVARLAAAPGQSLAPPGLKLSGDFKGFAASGLVGSNSPVFPDIWARWIPLVNAYDAFGRLRGSAGSLMYHYAGPYAQSAWAFFGVTNHDLFAPSAPTEMKELLVNTIEALIRKTFLHELKTDLACYRQGEQVKFSVQISNFGPHPRKVQVLLRVRGKEGGPSDFKGSHQAAFDPGTAATLTWTWKPKRFASDFYHVTAEMQEGKTSLDRMETGFVVWDPQVVASGFPVRLKGNYLRHGTSPEFLIGTNQTGMMFYSAHENPLVWDRDFKKMRDFGLSTLRILHFSPFAAKGYEGQGGHSSQDLKNRPTRLIRQLDAIVQLCQKYKIILFLSLHDWIGVELSDEDLAAQRDWNAFWARRYADVPGILYDVQNEPSVSLSNIPDLKRLWNNYLKERYGSEAALREAWRHDPPEKPLGEIDVEAGGSLWDDIKSFDANYFKVLTLNRWVKANIEGLKEGSPKHQTTVGYLPWMQPADKLLGNRFTDFSNMHYYGSLQDFARQFKLTDRRFDGKSFSLGEFGAQEAHDARIQGQTGDRPKASIERFLLYGHLALGMGASFIESWDWKDFDSCVFPWGLLHPCDDVPKDVLKAYRHMALLFRAMHPVNQQPSLYLLVPDSHRLGASYDRIHTAVLNAIDGLLANRVSFNVINEFDLDRLPKSAKTLLWPLPYCPRDETYALVKRFVEQGGSLYLSGDISYDDLRRRTRRERLQELCGVELVEENQPLTPLTVRACQAVEQGANVWIHTPGKGKVFFAAHPVELGGAPAALYRDFLKLAGESGPEVSPDIQALQAFVLPVEGGEAYVLFNHDENRHLVTLRIGKKEAALALAPHRPGLLLIGRKGDLLAVEAQGKVTYGQETIYDGKGHVAICSLDSQDIRRSRSLALFPFEPAEATLNTAAVWKQPLAEIGEYRNGKWQRLGSASIRASSSALHLTIDPLEALNILLIGEQGKMKSLRQRAEGWLAFK